MCKYQPIYEFLIFCLCLVKSKTGNIQQNGYDFLLINFLQNKLYSLKLIMQSVTPIIVTF